MRRLDVAAQVGRRYLDVVRSEALVALERDNVAVAERIVDAVRARSLAARASGAEVAKAEIALNRAHLDEQSARGTLRGMRVALAVLWGQLDPDFGATTGDPYSVAQLRTDRWTVARMDRNPDLELFASQMRVEDARARLSEAARHADVGWSAGIRRFEQPADQAFVLAVDVPIGNVLRSVNCCAAKSRPSGTVCNSKRRRAVGNACRAVCGSTGNWNRRAMRSPCCANGRPRLPRKRFG